MKKFAVFISTIVLLLVATVGFATYKYFDSAAYNDDVLPNMTIINGVDCSGLTYENAEKKLSSEWNSRYILISLRTDGKSLSFSDFDYEYDLIKDLKDIRKKNLIAAALNHYTGSPFKATIPMTISGGGNALKEKLVSSPAFEKKGAAESVDAYVDMSNPEFPIIKEIYGTKPDTDKIFEDITAHIQSGETRFIYDETKYFSSPSVTSKDPELIAYQKYCRKYLTQKITYEFGEETFTLSAQQIDNLLKDDMSGEVNKKAVGEFVADLATKYDNVGEERKFKSLTGKTITVPPGTYGWQIDQNAEATKLIADLTSGNDVSRKPEFLITGYGEYHRDMGNTYIDVDISEQTVKYYKEGKLIFSSSCVTGSRATGTITDVGAYYILNKIRNVTLKGKNADGSKYENFVSYWLGINWVGEGFHDATWRSTFGGNIWTYNGSHGCINMPPNQMPDLYEKAEVGIPVAVHY